MNYTTETLPDHVLEGLDKGSWPVRNARYRNAVCRVFNLKWISVGGSGDCFFESMRYLLLQAVGINLSASDIRKEVVSFFRECVSSTEPLCERICVEMEWELSQQLVCSTHKRYQGELLNGYHPISVADYIEASSFSGVWVQGLHWMRAISHIYDVRVGVVVWEHPIVRYIGSGEKTVFVYKVDADTHFDPLVSCADEIHVPRSALAPHNLLPSDALPIASQSSDNADVRPTIISDGGTAFRSFAQTLGLRHVLCKKHSVHGDQESPDTPCKKHSVHGDQESPDRPAFESSSEPPAPAGRPRRTCRMQCSAEPKAKRVASIKIASDTDSDTGGSVHGDQEPAAPAASQSRPKRTRKSPEPRHRRIKEDDSLLLISKGSTFVASSSAAAKELLLHRLSQTHVGGRVYTRGSDSQTVYLLCRSCTMKCRAGCKKQDLHTWNITACCDSAMQACPGERHPSLTQTGAPDRNSSTDIPQDSANCLPNFPEGSEVVCVVCYESTTRSIACPSGHAMDLDCFVHHVQAECSQKDPAQMQTFIQRGGVRCTICSAANAKPWTFDIDAIKNL